MLCLLLQWCQLYCLRRKKQKFQKKIDIYVPCSHALYWGWHRCLFKIFDLFQLWQSIKLKRSKRYLLILLWLHLYVLKVSALIQMAKVCIRISKHGEIIDHLHIWNLVCSYLEFVYDLDLWGLSVFCFGKKKIMK